MKLIFKGIVQGVGFRPTLYRIAKDMGLKGYVLNKGSEVEVVIDKNKEDFIKNVKKQLPSIAKITEIKTEPYNRKFDDFKILYSKSGKRNSYVPADIAICDNCLEELFDTKNRRYFFPFTNCTVCGARYSLIKDVPYDRKRTSMQDFNLCTECKKEYQDYKNRRYHAQTISCPNCGPRYLLYDSAKNEVKEKNILKKFAEFIDSGKIGVIKSWGGMHLCCNMNELKKFRKWYNRPQKSFAIMVKDFDTANKYAEISENEKSMLLSSKRPIVLLNKKKAEEVSPGLDTIGIFLPFTGLHHLLFSYLKSDAVVMTSANIPGEPMIINNQDAFLLGADYYLLHNREIPNRIDDSVLRVWKGKTFFLRKSRGYVPEPIEVNYKNRIVCVGAGQNNCGAISVDKKLFLTQYVGNSEFYKTNKFLEESLIHLLNLTMKDIKLDAVGMDLHPGYDSKRVAKIFSDKFSVPVLKIQHHWAHAASLLIDNNVEESVILTLDGLGYGSDGNLWGGEVLLSRYDNFKRVGHLENIPLIGGDKATHDPRRIVFAVFDKFKKEKCFYGSEAKILRKTIKNSPISSSMGRVLDALSCYLGICEKRTYDGEPAMKLEKYLAKGKPSCSFDVEIKNNVVNTTNLFNLLDEFCKKDITESKKADISHSFVKSIVDSLTDIAIENAKDQNISKIGLTGGVSYNIPITEMVEKRVKKSGLNLLVHDKIPNGDGGISAGQNVIIGQKLNL